MSNELVVRKHELSFDEMTRAAKAMAMSGYFSDARDVSQAMVKVLAGAEMGLGPFAAMSNIHIIKSKPVLGANLIATLIKNDGRYDYRVVQLDDDGCTIDFFEHGERVGQSSFTAADAKAAGLSGDNWRKFPRNMYFARAISNGAKWYTPGIFGGAAIYTPDELGAEEDGEGHIINVTRAAPQVDAETGEILEGDVVEFDDIPSASGTQDKRGNASPQAQAKRSAKRPAANGVDPAGARTAAETKAALIAAAMDGSAEPASDKQLKYVRSSVSSLVESDADKAKLLLFHIYGVDSSSDLTGGQASALIDWIGATAANKYTPSEAAQLEAHRLLRAFEVEAGQQELAL